MTKKYISPEHAIRNLMEGLGSAALKAGPEVMQGFKIGNRTFKSAVEVLDALKSGSIKTHEIDLNAFKGVDRARIEAEIAATPAPKPVEPAPEPIPEPTPAPAPEKPANDPNPPGVTPIREPAAPTPVEPYKVPEWNPPETPKPANDPNPSPKPSEPAPKPEAEPAKTPTPEAQPVPNKKVSPSTAPRLSPEASPKNATEIAPRLAPEAALKAQTKPPRGAPRRPFFPGGSTPGQEVGMGSGGVFKLSSYTHTAGERRVFEENEADKARSEIVNVPRPNAKDAKVNRTRQNEIIKKIHEENMAKKNIILNAIKEKKTPPSVELNPKLKDKDPGGEA